MTLKKIGQYLRAERQRRGLSVYRIELMTGENRVTINAIERGERGYNIKALLLYAEAMKLTVQISPL